MVITGNPADVAGAYIAARSEIQSVMKKDAKGVHNSKYTTLAAIIEASAPILAKYKLALLQEPTTNEFGVAIATSILHESGASIDFGPLTMPLAKNEPQAVGSAISYARRYAISAVLGLASDDDDGQKAQDGFRANAPAQDYNHEETWAPTSNSPKQPDTVSPAQLTRLTVLVADFYGSEAAEQQVKLSEAVSKGSVRQFKDLTAKEAQVLIGGIEKKMKQLQPATNGKVAA